MQAELIVGTDFIIDPNEFSVKSDQPAFCVSFSLFCNSFRRVVFQKGYQIWLNINN